MHLTILPLALGKIVKQSEFLNLVRITGQPERKNLN